MWDRILALHITPIQLTLQELSFIQQLLQLLQVLEQKLRKTKEQKQKKKLQMKISLRNWWY